MNKHMRIDRTYEGAISLLNNIRRTKRPESKGASTPHTDIDSSWRGRPSLAGMREWLQTLGYADNDINDLNVIHVAGTKGKGSTCAFVNSFLRAHAAKTGYPRKIGLYTSPHLLRVEERFRINSQPISEDAFVKYVFEVWSKLSLSSSSSLTKHNVSAKNDKPSLLNHDGPSSSEIDKPLSPKIGELSPEAVESSSLNVDTLPSPNGDLQTPRYLQFLMLLSIHTFISEGVDVAIYETHSGGEFDATNIFKKPVVTGITTLGMDHVDQLGPTLENIAWHKGGILKEGTPAFSSLQEPSATAVLQQRANEKNVTLNFVDISLSLPPASQLLDTQAQKVNSSLALALVDAFLSDKAPSEHQSMTFQTTEQGVNDFFWPGRFHRIVHGKYQWFLDGAHNDTSLQKAAQWFAKSARDMQATNILIFSQVSERDGAGLLKILVESLQERTCEIDHVIFSSYEERQDGTIRTGMIAGIKLILISDGIDQVSPDQCLKPATQNLQVILDEYVRVWKSLNVRGGIHTEPTIEGALELAKKLCNQSNGMQTFITGSLYLVGGALLFLEPTSATKS